MQGPVHLVTGILIQKGMGKVRPLFLQYFLVAFLAIMSHGILDKLARFTYHPPDPLIGDWFWISYHLIIAFLVVFIFVKYWRKYRLGLIFSILPDFDWVVIHSSNFLSFPIPFWKEKILHKFFFSFLDFLLPFSFLNTLPNLSLERIGVVPEIALFTILLLIIHIMDKRESNMRKEKAEKTYFNGAEGKYTKCNDKKAISTSDWFTKLQIYQTCMDHEQNIRTSYQSLLTTLEIALFALVFTLYQYQLVAPLWVLSTIGMFVCFPFGIACEYRARNVDIWRIRIVELVSGTDVEDAFKEGKYRWIPFGKVGFWGEYLFGHWFERILISGKLMIWLILLWCFPSPFIIRLCGTLATCFWIIYAFRIIELKGKIIPYLHRR